MGCHKNKITRINCDIDIFKTDWNMIDKVVYAFIHSLINKKGYCFASNDYFVKSTGSSLKTITSSLQRLGDRGVIVRKTWTVKKKISRRYIYLTAFKDINLPDDAKIKDSVYAFTKEDLKFFKDMWKGYTLDYVKTKKGKDGNFRGGGSKFDAKEKFRAILKAGIPTSTIEEFVSGFMNLDMPKDLSTLLKLGDVKMLHDETKKNGKLVKLQDIVTGLTKSVSEEDAKALEGKRWMRI